MRRLLFIAAATLLAASIAQSLAGPVWAQDPPIYGSETCPNGLRTIQDPLSESGALSCADLSNADLSGADLTDADLFVADLSSANLINANLTGADLLWANLANAKLSGANLSHADLTDADMSGATYNSATLFPVFFDPFAADMVRLDE